MGSLTIEHARQQLLGRLREIEEIVAGLDDDESYQALASRYHRVGHIIDPTSVRRRVD